MKQARLILFYAFLIASNASFAQSFTQIEIVPGSGGSAPGYFTVYQNELYFEALGGQSAGDDQLLGRELWKTDGSEPGTVLVQDITPGITSSYLRNFLAATGYLFFEGDERPFRTDGTEAGTIMLADVRAAFGGFTEFQSKVYFWAEGDLGREVYVTDGSAVGTSLLKDIHSDVIVPTSDLEVSGNLLFFAADDGISGRELWLTNGTEEGTVLVHDILPGADGDIPISSNPANLTDVNGTLFFSINTGSANVDRYELWKSDGTSNGTQLVRQFASTVTGHLNDFVSYQGNLYFLADNGTTGTGLWVSDGTEAGTHLVKDLSSSTTNSVFIHNSVELNGVLYLLIEEPDFGTELWRTDGTETGTYIVSDINPGISDGVTANDLVILNNEIYFVGNDPAYGDEIWKTDGSEMATVRMSDINAGSASGAGSHLVAFNGQLVFTGNNGVNGWELWILDPVITSTVTSLNESLFTIYPNPCTGTINIKAPSEGTVNVYSVNGTFVSSVDLEQSIGSIKDLDTGIYFVEFIKDDIKSIRKLIVY